jgi:RNA polymerase sigma-70 factor (ECF subfamily)
MDCPLCVQFAPRCIIAPPNSGFLLHPPLAADTDLSDFLQSVEKRAFKRTVYAVRDDEAALDIVQDAMIRLADRYADRPAAEWPMLFQRILSNATMDWFRHRKVKQAVETTFSDLERHSDDPDFDILETLSTQTTSEGIESAAQSYERTQALGHIEEEVEKLPARQREAFLMRYWEELDVAETASAMGCSEGSVKTHCSRAVQALAKALRARGISL